MDVKIKKLHPDAVIPKYSKRGDAGLDLTAVSKYYDSENEQVVYDVGIAFEIPEGYVGLLFPRSSICNKNLSLSNAVGVLDSGFRSSPKFKFRQTPTNELGFKEYNVGERIGQILILPYPQINFIETDELSATDRGTGGFGSTGN